jgi:hypothetical protein
MCLSEAAVNGRRKNSFALSHLRLENYIARSGWKLHHLNRSAEKCIV